MPSLMMPRGMIIAARQHARQVQGISPLPVLARHASYASAVSAGHAWSDAGFATGSFR